MTDDDETLVYLRIPRQAMQDFTDACRTGRAEGGTDAQGVVWYWAPGAPEEERVEVSFSDSSDDVLLRIASDGDSTLIVWTAEEWAGFLRHLPA